MDTLVFTPGTQSLGDASRRPAQRTSPWLPVPTVGAMGADAALDSWVILKKANKE